MIFDDHDITDDRNITKEWYENVRNSDCGKQIVSNSLEPFGYFKDGETILICMAEISLIR